MKTKGQLSYLAVELILLFVFNVIAFMIPFNRTSAFWTAYVFTMGAIVISFAFSFYAFSGNKKSRFYGFSLIIISWTYLLIQAILGLLFMSLSMVPYEVPFIACVILLAAYLIGMIAADTSKDYVQDVDKKIKESTFFLKSLQIDMQEIITSVNDPELSDALVDLADEIKYSDPVSLGQLANIETRIENNVIELKSLVDSGNYKDAIRKAKNTRQLVVQRNEKMKLLK